MAGARCWPRGPIGWVTAATGSRNRRPGGARRTRAPQRHPRPGPMVALELEVKAQNLVAVRGTSSRPRATRSTSTCGSSTGLGRDGLTVTATAPTSATLTLPFGIGFHPYLRPAGRPIDTALLVVAGPRAARPRRPWPAHRRGPAGRGDRVRLHRAPADRADPARHRVHRPRARRDRPGLVAWPRRPGPVVTRLWATRASATSCATPATPWARRDAAAPWRSSP